MCTADLSGKEVLDYLNAAAKMNPGAGAFPQFAGIELDISAGVASHVRIKGMALDADKTYRIAVNSFQAAGGDGYPKLSSHPSFVNTGFNDAQVLHAFIVANTPLKAASFEPGLAVLRR